MPLQKALVKPRLACCVNAGLHSFKVEEFKLEQVQDALG